MSASEKLLRIDIPVKLTDVKVVFSIAALAFEGDLPASIFHLQLIRDDSAGWNANAEIIAVFHTNAGHVTLNDHAYNADRNIATGNPYKELVADLQKRGVRIELCGATAKAHHWWKRRSAPQHQGQHRCHGENDAARSRRFREDYGMSRAPPPG
jgi:hypothetical protein